MIDPETINGILDDAQKIRNAIDDLAAKLSPLEGFAVQHGMLLRIRSDVGFVMKKIRSRAEELAKE